MLSVSTPMICCIIKEKYSIILPAWLISVQNLHNMPDEESHEVAVGRGMRQGEPHFAGRVNRRHQRYPRCDRFHCHIAFAVARRPHSLDECGLVQPCLVYVDDPLAFIQQVYHRQCILLPLYLDLRRVAVGMQLLRPDESQLHIFLHD